MPDFALISDIHGNHLALKAVLEDIKRRGINNIYCLGDLVGYAPFPDEVVEIIKGETIPTVMGNYDDGVGFDRLICGCDFPDEEARLRGERSLAWTKAHTTEGNKAFLRGLPKEIRIEVEGYSMLLVHGTPRALNEYLYEDTADPLLEEVVDAAQADILVVGHTHKPFYRVFSGCHLVNAGSVGRPKHCDPKALYCILTVNDGIDVEFVKVSYDTDTISKAILLAGLPESFAELIRTGKE